MKITCKHIANSCRHEGQKDVRNGLNNCCSKRNSTNPKALFLVLMALASSGGIININKNNNLFAEDLKQEGSSTNNQNTIDEKKFIMIFEKISKLNDIKQSYYYDYYNNLDNTISAVNERKFADYKSILCNIPDVVRLKGKKSIEQYQNGVMSILENCDEYGAMYIKNVPDKENMSLHSAYIERLLTATNKVQGCKCQNIAMLNGLTAEELIKKVVMPNEKIANNEKIGNKENTIIFITNEFGTDIGNAYIDNYNDKIFSQKNAKLAYKNYEFDESFLGHYDNIILIQPNGINADDALNNAFANIEASIEKGSHLDIAYMSHSNESGTTLSKIYKNNGDKQVNRLDIKDFGSSDKGGQPYAQSIKSILKNSIEAGYKPRFIALGCDSDNFESFFKEFNGDVHVFGTPYTNNSKFILGFNNNSLLMVSTSSKFYKNYGLLYAITELNQIITPATLNSFLIDDGLEADQTFPKNSIFDKILLEQILSNKRQGIVEKQNGMTMIYDTIKYRD